MHSDRRTEAVDPASGAPTAQPIRLPTGSNRKGADAASEYEKIGPYRLLGKVGEGGMGVVYKALDPRGQIVAVKVLRAHIAYDAGARERLRREVATLSLVRSSRIGWVLDADVDGDRPFLVTRYVNGPPLDAVVDEVGPLRPEPLAALGRGVAEALRDIHDAGIVHRDLKPGNVLMDGEEPVLIDFGIAHVADETRLTSTGLVMGTPGYLSPEIVEGGEVTEATDWWGWAATLAYAASGVPPFGRGPMHAVLDRVSEGRADLQRVDPRLRPLLAAALRPDPARRPSATEVLEQLEVYGSGGQTTVIPVSGGTTSASAIGEQPRAADGQSRPDRDPARRPEPAPRPVGLEAALLVERGAQPAATGNDWDVDSTHEYDAPPPYDNRLRGQSTGYDRPYDERPYEQSTGYDRPYDERPYEQSTGYDRPYDEQPQPRYDAGPVAEMADAGHRIDPRIGQAARTGTLAALTVAAVGLAAHWPVLSLIVIFAWSFAARWSDRAVTSMVLRRYRAGPRKYDNLVAVTTSPWHALVGAFSALLTIVIPVFVAACVAAAAAVAMHLADHAQTSVGRPIPMVLGVLAGCAVLWWGPGSAGMRRGSRTIVRAVARDVPATRVVVAACLAVAVVTILVALAPPDHAVSWLPYSDSSQLPLSNLLPSLPGS